MVMIPVVPNVGIEQCTSAALRIESTETQIDWVPPGATSPLTEPHPVHGLPKGTEPARVRTVKPMGNALPNTSSTTETLKTFPGEAGVHAEPLVRFPPRPCASPTPVSQFVNGEPVVT